MPDMIHTLWPTLLLEVLRVVLRPGRPEMDSQKKTLHHRAQIRMGKD